MRVDEQTRGRTSSRGRYAPSQATRVGREVAPCQLEVAPCELKVAGAVRDVHAPRASP
eukprot:CAMPEP_0174752208 /NCGR_PEP_ID=MMETSP1094-20130205/101526_1 /TAXON_ID=156173 /ORGANISM="Chrysochromulina brevifilum, Strain UTEX LB 985" /LENGTH=57 /DNA_ID=CAMNT_0015957815 /DNA_START=244 /DNA_END=417 /DNA_ORIENTATION=-